MNINVLLLMILFLIGGSMSVAGATIIEDTSLKIPLLCTNRPADTLGKQYRVRIEEKVNPRGEIYLRARLDQMDGPVAIKSFLISVETYVDHGKRSDIYYGDSFYLDVSRLPGAKRRSYLQFISQEIGGSVETILECQSN